MVFITLFISQMWVSKGINVVYCTCQKSVFTCRWLPLRLLLILTHPDTVARTQTHTFVISSYLHPHSFQHISRLKLFTLNKSCQIAYILTISHANKCQPNAHTPIQTDFVHRVNHIWSNQGLCGNTCAMQGYYFQCGKELAAGSGIRENHFSL